RRKVRVAVLRGERGRRDRTPIPKGHRKGNAEVACESRNRAEPHANVMTPRRLGIPRAGKWPSIGILVECRKPDIRAERDGTEPKSSLPISRCPPAAPRWWRDCGP